MGRLDHRAATVLLDCFAFLFLFSFLDRSTYIGLRCIHSILLVVIWRDSVFSVPWSPRNLIGCVLYLLPFINHRFFLV